MGHRHISRNKKRKSMYLNEEFEEVNRAANAKGSKRKGNMAIQLPQNVKHGSPAYGGGGAWGYGGGTTVGHESHTHKGDKVIFEHDGKALYAGNGRGVDECSGNWDLIIDLANNIGWNATQTCIKDRTDQEFKDALKKYVYQPKQIKSKLLCLDWPDMGVLAAGLDFWLKLWSMLPPKTVMMCMGGHGRTGTCMVALMIAAGESYYEALEKVRKNHCDRAVESVSQTKYLHALYVERLKRNLTWAKKSAPQHVSNIEAELLYAEQHVPNTYSDYGEPEPPPKKGSKSTGVHKGHVSDEELAADRLKLVGSMLYEQVCVDPVCKVRDCRNAEHQGWIEYDPEALMVQ